eukprot:1141146-Pelagomonas_calceolata.AAC.6
MPTNAKHSASSNVSNLRWSKSMPTNAKHTGRCILHKSVHYAVRGMKVHAFHAYNQGTVKTKGHRNCEACCPCLLIILHDHANTAAIAASMNASDAYVQVMQTPSCQR